MKAYENYKSQDISRTPKKKVDMSIANDNWDQMKKAKEHMARNEKKDEAKKRTTSDGHMVSRKEPQPETSADALREWKRTGVKPKGLKKVSFKKAFSKGTDDVGYVTKKK